MKKVIKVLLFVVAAVVVLVAIGAIFINVRGIPTYETQKLEYTAVADSTQLVRGKKFASMLCAGCHLNPETGKLSGVAMEDAPEFGKLFSQNITHDMEYGIGTWTDGEILYLLRTGILRDGRYAPPYMAKLPYMADEDIEAVIAFIRSDDPMVEAVNEPDHPCEPSFLTKMLTHIAFKPLPFPTDPIPMPDTTNAVAWGKYLVLNLDCWTCHSPSFESMNMADPEKTPGYLSGGNPSLKTKEGQAIVTLNLTPDVETGIGSWSEQKFVNAVRFGIVEGQEALRYPMEPYSLLTDHEAKAIYAYLKTVPPISHQVERTVLED